jgi:sugar phosphate isomerase/epimerase
MLRVSYNANGLRNLPLSEAIGEVAAAGFDGIELSLHPNHIDPFTVDSRALDAIAARLGECGLPATCLATGADLLLGPERFEPSLIHPSAGGRRRRVDVIRRSVAIARRLGIPTVNIASGILRSDIPVDVARGWLVDGIRTCLDSCGDDVALAIEPEVGFLVQVNAEAVALVEEVADPRLGVNQDIGHENVGVDDYIGSIRRTLPVTRNIHVEDIRGRVHKHLIPGEGDIDFTGLFRALADGCYDGPISVELYDHAHDYARALRESLAYLQAAERSTPVSPAGSSA